MKSKRFKKSKKKYFSYAWNIIFYVCMLFILFSAVLMAIMQQQNKSLNGYRMFGVLTDSMVSPGNKIKKGGFRSGDILITKEVPYESIKVGDVITYHPSANPSNAKNNYLTHRVVKIDDRLGEEKGLFFTTRGDANKTDDMPIKSSSVIGKQVFIIPKIGGVLAFAKENWIVSLVFIFSFVGFIWIMKNYILVSTKPKKRSKKKKKSLKSKRNRASLRS